MRAYTASRSVLCVLLAAFAPLFGGCGAVGHFVNATWGEPPATPVQQSEAVESARAVIGLAGATATLNAMVASPGTSRALARGTDESTGVGGPEVISRTVTRAEAPARPERTLVTVQAIAGPPVERTGESEAPRARTRRSAGERWLVPVSNPRVTSRFGPRTDPITGQRGRMHRGTDFGAPTGTPVYATASGTVVLGGWCDRGTGNCIVMDHAGGWRSQYFHLSRVRVAPGDVVRQGQLIGEVGSTGRSTGPHLHFQLGRDGVAVDPETLFGRPVE